MQEVRLFPEIVINQTLWLKRFEFSLLTMFIVQKYKKCCCLM